MKKHENILEGEDTIHTVVKLKTKFATGYALGVDRAGKPFRLILRTERAMEKAIDRVEAFGRLLGMKPTLRPADSSRMFLLASRASGPVRDLR